MQTNRSIAVASLALLAAIAAPATAYEYALDDGSGTYNIGPSAWDAEVLWGNYFNAAPGAETVTSISVSFGSGVPLDAPATAVLFNDPDNDLDPTNAVPLTQTTLQTVDVPMNTFIDFDIPDTQVSGGFFVGITMSLLQGDNAARMDPEGVQGQSWLFFDGEIDLDNLGGSPLYYNMNQTPFNGAWMVRANAVPEPATLTIALLLAAATLRRKR